jgi:hypothetical protein
MAGVTLSCEMEVGALFIYLFVCLFIYLSVYFRSTIGLGRALSSVEENLYAFMALGLMISSTANKIKRKKMKYCRFILHLFCNLLSREKTAGTADTCGSHL